MREVGPSVVKPLVPPSMIRNYASATAGLLYAAVVVALARAVVVG